MMRRTIGLVKLGVKWLIAARFPISASVGYGTINPASARIFSRWVIASVKVEMSSPASRADDGGAEDAPAPVGHYLDVPAGCAFDPGAVVFMIGPAQDADRVPGSACLIFRQADLCQFGVRVGHPRDRIISDSGRQPEQGVPDHDTRVVIGDMGELQSADDVADRIDVLVGRAQVSIDRDAVRRGRNAGALEPEAFDRGRAAGRDQEVAAFDHLAAAQGDLNSRGAGDLHQPDAGAENYAVALERGENNRGAFRIVLAERGRRFDHGHGAAEPAERLREFDPDRTAADDQEVLGLQRKIENRLVGEEWRLGDPGNPRNGWRRTGRDHEAPRLDGEPVVNRDGLAIGELRAARRPRARQAR